MNRSYISFSSVTLAGLAADILSDNKISSRIVKKPSPGRGRSCSYGLVVQKSNIEKAYRIISERKIENNGYVVGD